MFKRKKAHPAPVDLDLAFGAELAATLVRHLGREESMDLARALVADGKRRWTTDVLTEEDRERVRKQVKDAGVYKVEDRAKFYSLAVAEKVGEAVVTDAMAQTGLPSELKPELAAQIAALLYSGVPTEEVP